MDIVEHIRVHPGDILWNRENGWKGKVIKIYPPDWGCECENLTGPHQGEGQNVPQVMIDCCSVMCPHTQEVQE